MENMQTSRLSSSGGGSSGGSSGAAGWENPNYTSES